MGQHDNTLKDSHGTTNALPHYYVCSPSVPPFIPQSPMSTTNPSHYPYLYQETYPQMPHMLPSGAPVYSSDFLKPPPMSHFVLNVDGTKVPVETKPTTKTDKDQKQKKYPWWSVFLTFTIWISVAQIAVFVISVVKGGFAPVSSNINIGPPTHTLVDMGAKVAFLMKYDSQGWRFVTAMFVHAGILHILLNLIAQIRLGVLLEREWGRMRFLIIYLVSGVASALMSCLIQPGSVSVGASGAILGLVGAYFAFIILIWKTLNSKEKKMQVIQALFILLVLGLLALTPYIDSSAHLGGLVIGFLLGFGLLPNAQTSVLARRARIVPLLLAGVFFGVGFWYFYSVEKPPIFAY
eukprot:Phypoly_transcript_10336.p1 GENE.Phypoly_transcript_10336~~Phypoly_transcript_10336.p1  ORF type:complete len:350 (+),score=45.07 Phypoly_transcript_10336:128-1177(+)